MSDHKKTVVSGFEAAPTKLNHLIAISSGFVDVFKIRCDGQATIILPQNLILSVQAHFTGGKKLTWNGQELPIYAVHQPNTKEGIALITGHSGLKQSFVILCDEMPEASRLRISEVNDVHGLDEKRGVFQYIRVAGELCQIPVLEDIYEDLTQ